MVTQNSAVRALADRGRCETHGGWRSDRRVERRLLKNTDAPPLPQIDNEPAIANRTMLASLGDMVGAFKSMVTTKINRARNGTGGLVWQRGYHERVIRNERELAAVRRYILANPSKWPDDPNNVRR
jgi:hypothetical protein